jgi:hypothetical protein
MMKSVTLMVYLGLVTLLASGAEAQQAGQKQSRNRNVITAEEIASRPGATTAYDLVISLRPSWLVTRGGYSAESGANVIILYVDGVSFGTTDDLDHVRADQIQQMRFLTGSDATTKYGTGHRAGAIEITTRH